MQLRLRSLAGASLGLLALAACGKGAPPEDSLCGAGNVLRVGYVGSEEGRQSSEESQLTQQGLEQVRNLLIVASRCDVSLEPVASPEQAHRRLSNAEWDLAFLPPGLAAMATEKGGAGGYSLLRPLGVSHNSRSMLLVRSDSPYRTLNQLQGARLGLLPRGSLTGFYLPLYNLHGLRLGSIHFALSYRDLLEQLLQGKIDAIAWDASLPDPGATTRTLQQDGSRIPLGGLALSQSLVAANHQPFLTALDEGASELPSKLGYVAAVLPDKQELLRLRNVIRSVESWTIPLEGQPYAVYGNKRPIADGEQR